MATTTPDTTRVQSATTVGFVARYLAIGAYFGFVLVKAEVLSWYRIQEMFRFHSFHMYGVIGSAVLVAALSVWLVRRYRLRSLGGEPIAFRVFEAGWARYVFGGVTFGLGWALTGACPGPIAALIGAGLTGFTVVLAAAVVGTWTYGRVRTALPH
jgi:uncharacterized membrane protein YedE/YeeE